ncbi:uncharacterized protein C6orf136 homolog isoform X2 [Syngnathoides biaculeatus]|uniref:uncharacterized protein C6orf136 homolog isoform X2 n=1 Tax=Syngnathoides biaculeatus TaxID=300417 RepID=UPI002ADE3F2D|nr:uncharacterized protein C6orf136 homolog isoform X2 [Syngnathoides biaculeatus]
MAVSRGAFAFWVGSFRIHGRRQPVTKHIGSLNQPLDLQWICHTCPFSSASWDLAPTNSLRNQTIKKLIPSQPFHHVSWPHTSPYHEDDWEESLSMCVLVRPNESSGVHTLVEIPLFGETKLGELLAPVNHKSSEFSFVLTTVDGSREDDISVRSFKRIKHPLEREHGCFRSLFEVERCPAPLMCGSQFYCFHSPGTQTMAHSKDNPRQDIGLEKNKEESPQFYPNSLCSIEARAEGSSREGDSEGEQKLAIAYKRLRSELPNFFRKNHDYTMYSNDIEFINGLLNTSTRGRVVYQLTLSLWRLMCLLYFADARLEVLKLTKHMEDGTIKARWRLRGLPFLTLMLRFYRKDKSQLYRRLIFHAGGPALIPPMYHWANDPMIQILKPAAQPSRQADVTKLSSSVFISS